MCFVATICREASCKDLSNTAGWQHPGNSQLANCCIHLGICCCEKPQIRPTACLLSLMHARKISKMRLASCMELAMPWTNVLEKLIFNMAEAFSSQTSASRANLYCSDMATRGQCMHVQAEAARKHQYHGLCGPQLVKCSDPTQRPFARLNSSCRSHLPSVSHFWTYRGVDGDVCHVQHI